jgi:hypothetical protein
LSQQELLQQDQHHLSNIAAVNATHSLPALPNAPSAKKPWVWDGPPEEYSEWEDREAVEEKEADDLQAWAEDRTAQFLKENEKEQEFVSAIRLTSESSEVSSSDELPPENLRRSLKVAAIKLMSSPCDPEFFVPFKESFNESKIPEFWQHYRGNLLAAPDGRIGCAGCCVEAVVSTNGFSLVCPKRSQFESAKRAQEQGCFFILKARCAELTVTKQEDILLYNSSKCSKTVKKTSELAKEILATKRKLDD